MDPDKEDHASEERQCGAVFPLTELHTVCCVPSCRGMLENLHPWLVHSSIVHKWPTEISPLCSSHPHSVEKDRTLVNTRSEPRSFRRHDTSSCVLKSFHNDRSRSSSDQYIIDNKPLTEPDFSTNRASSSSSSHHHKHGSVSPLSVLSLERVSRLVVQILKPDTTHETYKRVGTWLCKLGVKVDSVIWRVQQIRPPWLPMDLHWVEVEPDPLLLLIACVPQVQTLSYTPLPHALPALVALLCGLPNLTRLQLRHTADDAMLRMVGRSCPFLKVLCVKGARAVSDTGVRWLVLKPEASSRCAWRFLYRRWKELKPVLVSSQHQREYSALPPIPSIPASQCTDLAGSLRHLDLRGTKVTLAGAQWAARCTPHAHLLLLTTSVSHNLTSRTKRYHSLEEHQPDLFHLPSP